MLYSIGCTSSPRRTSSTTETRKIAGKLRGKLSPWAEADRNSTIKFLLPACLVAGILGLFLGINNEDTNFCSYLFRRFLTIDALKSWETSRRGRCYKTSSAMTAESSSQPSKIDWLRRGRGTWPRREDARSALLPKLPCLINSKRTSVNRPWPPQLKTTEWRS